MARFIVALTFVAIVATGGALAFAQSPPPPPTNVEVRVWQDIRDAQALYISARPEGGSWRTLGTIPLGRGQASAYATTSNGRYRYSDITIAGVDVRVWQRVSDARSLYISARPRGGSWRTLGTIPLELDGLSDSRRYRYGDITVAVAGVEPALPDERSAADHQFERQCVERGGEYGVGVLRDWESWSRGAWQQGSAWPARAIDHWTEYPQAQPWTQPEAWRYCVGHAFYLPLVNPDGYEGDFRFRREHFDPLQRLFASIFVTSVGYVCPGPDCPCAEIHEAARWNAPFSLTDDPKRDYGCDSGRNHAYERSDGRWLSPWGVCEWRSEPHGTPVPAIWGTPAVARIEHAKGRGTAFHVGDGVWLTAAHVGPMEVGDTVTLRSGNTPEAAPWIGWALPPARGTERWGDAVRGVVQHAGDVPSGDGPFPLDDFLSDLAVVKTAPPPPRHYITGGSNSDRSRYAIQREGGATARGGWYAVHHAGGSDAFRVAELRPHPTHAQDGFAFADRDIGTGASGAPVINSCGAVVGMVVGSEGTLLSADRIRALLNGWGIALEAPEGTQ